MRVPPSLAASVLVGALAVSGVAAEPSAGAAAKPTRVFLYAHVVREESGALSFRARVRKYPDAPIGLMKKNCETCAWHRAKALQTDDNGRVASILGVPDNGRWYWRYRTPASAKFAETFSSTWYTYSH